MKFALTLAAMAAFGFAYLYWVRPYLKTLPALSEAWASEETTLAALKVWIEGRKTIFTAIWGELIAMGPDALQIVSGVDLKTAFSLPDNWALIIGGLVVPSLMMIFRAKTKAA